MRHHRAHRTLVERQRSGRLGCIAQPEPPCRHPARLSGEDRADGRVGECGIGIGGGCQQYRHPGVGGQQSRGQLRAHPAGAQRAALPGGDAVEVIGSGNLGDEARVTFSRVGVVKPVDIGEQHQRVGSDQMRDQGRESVVVSEPDLIGGHGVVLIDDRYSVQRPQPVKSAGGVGVLDPLGDVVGGQQHLPDSAVIAGECCTPGVHERHLPDTGGGLLGGQVGGPTGQAERLKSGGDGSRGHDHHIGTGLHPRFDGVGKRRETAGVEHAGRVGLRAARMASRCALTSRPGFRDAAVGRSFVRRRRPGRTARVGRRCRGRSG